MLTINRSSYWLRSHNEIQKTQLFEIEAQLRNKHKQNINEIHSL